MNKLKQQFSDLKKSTPKHIQWLLLIAAFVVVVILLILLLSGDDKQEVVAENIASDEPLKLMMSPDSVNWAETKVGDSQSQTIKVYASAPVKIQAIRLTKEIEGFAAPQQTCTNMGVIDSQVACKIVLNYKPTTAHTTEPVALYIDWRGANEEDKMQRTNKIVVVLGASEPVVQKKAEEPAPVVQPEPVYVPEPVYEPAPVKETFKEEISAIALPDPIEMESVKETVIEETKPAESCSDFAFPGYNASGVQIGWIKPDAGAYYFHPFSDKDCSNPTGVYNPDNGIITDIKNRSKKIGTDAEHIGYATITNGALPQLSNAPNSKPVNKARQFTAEELAALASSGGATGGGMAKLNLPKAVATEIVGTSGNATYSTDPYDRTFVLRQYKPIPATIVSEVRADPSIYKTGSALPVRATVDRNVYADNGRTIVIPAGTLLLGYLTGTLPGPYTAIGRMNINWYQFILPNGVEFNFSGNPESDPFSGDSQGRVGVPGYGSTDYLEQFVMPMLTAIVPAAVNLIAPVADTFVNQIDLDNNTVVQSGTVRSSELAKNEIITAWNQVAQKLMVDMMDNSTPPFSIAAGTRITVYSPTDLVITCGTNTGKKCSVTAEQAKANSLRPQWKHLATPNYEDGSWVGQARSFKMSDWCTTDSNGASHAKTDKITLQAISDAGYSFSTVEFYCQTQTYQAINNAKQDALYQNQQQQFQTNYGTSTGSSFNTGTGLTGIQGSQSYNEDVLGLTYDDSGAIVNPFVNQSNETTQEETASVITCEGGALPDANGCCPGEVFTDMGEQGFNCCPETGGDCFPPILY